MKPRGRAASPGAARTLFVYGSLLRGLVNHGRLRGARFLREAATEPAFTLVDLGAYPALVREGHGSITGELYAVPARLVSSLDAFEGHPRFYRRSKVLLADGSTAEAYLLPEEHAASLPRVAGTSWREAILARRAAGGYPNPSPMSPLPIPASGVVVWITGLPSSGKSTLAARLRQRLVERGRASCVLDGDEVRAALVPAPGYTPEARDDFYATLARLAALLAAQGVVVIVPATAHRAAYRASAKEIAPRFIEVHVDVPVEECGRRDAKGLYAATRAGDARGLPGADLAYEAPEAADVVAQGGHDDAAVARALALIDAPA